jgi:hypothetical protein
MQRGRGVLDSIDRYLGLGALLDSIDHSLVGQRSALVYPAG